MPDRFETVTAAAPGSIITGDPNFVPFSLGDIDLIALEQDRLSNGNTSRLNSLNAVTGDTNGWYDAGQTAIGEIIARNNGNLLGFSAPTTAIETDASVQPTYTWDIGAQTVTPVGSTGLQTFEAVLNGMNIQAQQSITLGTNGTRNGNGMIVTAVAELNPRSNNPTMFIVARRGNGQDQFTALTGAGLGLILVTTTSIE